MSPKSALWRPIAIALAVVNVAGAGFATARAEPWHATAHAVLALACWLWAQRLRHRRPATEVDRLRALVGAQAQALEHANAALADQSARIAELEERVEFSERLLARARERGEPGPREERR